MKIGCESCGARYSIADQKVRGKAFRIRCKRCGEAMIVRGAEPADAASPAGASEAGPIWHLVLDGEPRGPFRTDTVTQMLSEGSIDEDTYVWRSGHEAWSRLGEVDALAGPSHAAVAAVVSSAPSVVAALGADSGMTGARHESSVLFSLGTLQSLAMRGAPGARRASSRPDPGSGLLDLRALSAGAPSAPAAAGARAIEDLLSIGVPGAFPSPLGAPLLVPAPARSSRLLHALVAVAALLLLGIVGLLVLALGQRPLPPPPVLAPEVGAVPIAPPVAAPPAHAIAVPNADATPPSETPDPSAEPPAVPRAVVTRPRPEGPRAPPRDATPPREEPGHEGHEIAKSTGRESIEELVRRAVAPEDAAEAPRDPPPRPTAPVQPARSDVQAALRAVQGAVRACAAGQSGTATIRFVFAPTGLVTTTSVVSPPFAGTSAGSCMARAARAARVPSFSGQSLVVSYPFVVR